MTSKEIISLLKKKYPKKDIVGIRGLTKVGEQEFSFRYTYRSGDFLSLSDLLYVKKDKKTPSKIVANKIKQSH